MNLKQIIDQIRNDKNCLIKEPDLNTLISEHAPDDLKQFYELTDGIVFFPNEPYSIKIVGRKELKPINNVLFSPDEWEDIKDEVSSSWLLIGLNKSMGQYISLDSTEVRKGRCYDSFHETHAIVGNSPIIAKNFIELLEQLYKNKGQYWYWLEDDFEKLGDAYDE